jgi:translation elongation factor EF-4
MVVSIIVYVLFFIDTFGDVHCVARKSRSLSSAEDAVAVAINDSVGGAKSTQYFAG